MTISSRIFVLAILLLAGTTSAIHAMYPAPPTGAEWAEGVVLIKLAPHAVVRVGASGSATTGIASVDAELKLHGVVAVTATFDVPARYPRLPAGATFRSYTGALTEVPDLSRWVTAILSREIDEESVARALNALGDVEVAEPAYYVHVDYMPNDEYADLQYPIHNEGQACPAVVWGGQIMETGLPDADLDLPEAWDVVTAVDTVIVAVIDTGIDYDHPDIVNNLWINTGEVPADSLDNDENGYVDDVYGYNFRDHHGDPLDDDGHGTHVGGTISAVADNSIGVAGGAYGVKIMSCKFLSGGTNEDGAESIVYAVDNGAHILNNSWGGPEAQVVTDAVDYAVGQGVIVFASAGNSASSIPQSPVLLENVIGVAATDIRDMKATFSCFGDWVELSAPGVNVLSLRADSTDMFASAGEPLVHIFPYPDGAYYLSDGTSMSCPYACATAAMVKSYYPLADYDEVVGRVLAGCDPVGEHNKAYAGLLGSGRANVLNSLNATPAPHLIYISHEVDDSSGNGDGRMDPGETVGLTVTLRNLWLDALSASAELGCSDPAVNVVSPTAYYGDMATWQTKANDLSPFVVELTGGFEPGDWLEFTLHVYGVGRFDDTMTFWVKTHLPELAGWPVSVPGNLTTNPAVGDIDNDQHPDVMVAVPGQGVFAFDRNGDALDGFPASFGSTFPSEGMAVGNIDGNPGSEVIIGTWANKVYAFDGSGATVPGWPVDLPQKVYATPALYNLAGDATPEIVIACNDGMVYVLDAAGGTVTGWPRQMEAGTSFQKVKASPCVGDVDDQGNDIVVGAAMNGKVYVWNADGTGYVNPDGFFAQTDTSNMRVSPIMGDADGDARLEIFIADESGKVYGWNDDGTDMSGWPVQAGGPANIYYQSPAMGDIDGDGCPEILLCSRENAVYAWNHDGTEVENWPARPPGGDPINSSPAIAQLDADVDPEVVFGGPEPYVSGMNGDATIALGWPADVGSRANTAPVVVDLDGDGDVEVVCSTYTEGVHAIDCAGAVVSGLGWWTEYRHDASRTGTVPIWESTGVAGASAKLWLAQNRPNPFNPRTTIEFFVPRTGHVDLTIYDVAGRRVTSLVDGPVDAGEHTAVWTGSDGRGHSVATGVYFVRLTAGDGVATRKMVLIR